MSESDLPPPAHCLASHKHKYKYRHQTALENWLNNPGQHVANIQIFKRIYRNFALICCFAAKEKVSWYWDSSVLCRAFDTLHEYCRQDCSSHHQNDIWICFWWYLSNQNDYKYCNAVYQITALPRPTVIAAVSKVSSGWPRSRSHMNCCCFVYFTVLSFLSLQLGNADSASTNPPSVGTGIVKNTYIHDILWQKQTTVRQWVNWLFLQKVTWLWFLLKEFPVSTSSPRTIKEFRRT